MPYLLTIFEDKNRYYIRCSPKTHKPQTSTHCPLFFASTSTACINKKAISIQRHQYTMKSSPALLLLFVLDFLPFLKAFAPCRNSISTSKHIHHEVSSSFVAPRRMPPPSSSSALRLRIDQKRRDELGISDDEEEYDLGVALSNNTDAGITKIIAGSFILVMVALLVVGLVFCGRG